MNHTLYSAVLSATETVDSTATNVVCTIFGVGAVAALLWWMEKTKEEN